VCIYLFVQLSTANILVHFKLANTSEVTGWLMNYVLQSPKLYETIKAEVDALPSGSLVDVDIKAACPYLNSAIQETLRLSAAVFAGRTVTGKSFIKSDE
jgi:cytochrome P450